MKFKVLTRIPVAQATSSSSINEVLREQDRLLAEELKRVRVLRVLKHPPSGVEGVELKL